MHRQYPEALLPGQAGNGPLWPGGSLRAVTWWAVATLFVVGLVCIGVLSGLSTVVQLRAPEAFRGRVLSFFLVALGVAYPVGSLVQGPVIDRIGLGWTTAGTAGLLALIMAWVALRRPGLALGPGGGAGRRARRGRQGTSAALTSAAAPWRRSRYPAGPTPPRPDRDRTDPHVISTHDRWSPGVPARDRALAAAAGEQLSGRYGGTPGQWPVSRQRGGRPQGRAGAAGIG